MLTEGDKAPDFELDAVDADGSITRVSLQDFRDRTLVLYFYPKDSTPGCTREAQAFTAARRAIETAGGAVVGVSRDSPKTHCTFRDKFGLSLPLASDPDLSTHRAYGAWGTKTMYGRKVEGCIRSTFLVRDGRIARVFPSVKVDGHADAVLQAIGELAHGPSSRLVGVKERPAPKAKKKTTAAKPKKKAAAKAKKTSAAKPKKKKKTRR